MKNRVRPFLALGFLCWWVLTAQAQAGSGADEPPANPVRTEIGYTRDDNINRARDAQEKLSDDLYSVNVAKSAIFPLTDHTRMVVTGLMNAEKLRRFKGLDRIALGVQGEFQYR